MSLRVTLRGRPVTGLAVYRSWHESPVEAIDGNGLFIFPNDVTCLSVNSASQLRDHIDTARTVMRCYGAPEEFVLAVRVENRWRPLTEDDYDNFAE